jgi:hypothetical protein
MPDQAYAAKLVNIRNSHNQPLFTVNFIFI